MKGKHSDEVASIFSKSPKNIHKENVMAIKEIKKTQNVSRLYPRPRFYVD